MIKSWQTSWAFACPFCGTLSSILENTLLNTAIDTLNTMKKKRMQVSWSVLMPFPRIC